MFNQSVLRQLCFPATVQDNVCITNNVADSTAFMTATILLYNRVDNLKLILESSANPQADKINNDPNVYAIYWFDTKEDADTILNPEKKRFTRIEKMPTHEKFLSEQMKKNIQIRTMPEENTVCIFVDGLTLANYHCTQFFIPKYFKIFKEKPQDQDEISFLQTLTYKTSGNYINAITELASKDTFQKFILKKEIAGFEKALYKKKVEYAKKSLDTIEKAMEKAMEDYKNASRNRIDAMALVVGLTEMANRKEEETELEHSLVRNKSITQVKLRDSHICFIAKTFLAPYHIEDWDKNSARGTMFTQYTCSEFPNAKDIKLLLDSILSSKRCLKVKICAYFDIDYFGTEVNSQKNYPFNDELKDYIPNPHLNRSNCLSQNRKAILDQLAMGDAVGAIECAIACAQRINIHESISFSPFVRELLSSSKKCLVAEDGTEFTAKEAVAYLKGKENA